MSSSSLFLTVKEYRRRLKGLSKKDKKEFRSRYYVILLGFPHPLHWGMNNYDGFTSELLPSNEMTHDFKVEEERLGSDRAWNLTRLESRYRRQILNSDVASICIGLIRHIKKESKGKQVIYVFSEVYRSCPFWTILDEFVRGAIGDSS